MKEYMIVLKFFIFVKKMKNYHCEYDILKYSEEC